MWKQNGKPVKKAIKKIKKLLQQCVNSVLILA
jgi:hypothetical protein